MRARTWLILVVAAAIVVAANVDHRWKTGRIQRAEVARWYCAHQGTRCGGDDPERLEQLWAWRERGYWGALVVVAATGGLLLVRGRRRA